MIMNKYFQGKYRVGSARLAGYDYSRPGKYFVTICTRNMECFFASPAESVNETKTGGITRIIGKLMKKFRQQQNLPYI